MMLLALCLRLQHLAAMEATPVRAYHTIHTQSDSFMFDQWAQRIVAGDPLGRHTSPARFQWQLALAPEAQWRAWSGNAPVFFKAPFYAYLLALLRLLFGGGFLPVALLQVLASTLALPLLFRISEQVLGRGAAVAASLLYATYAPAIHYDVLMLRGPWVTLLALAVTWSLLRVRERPGARTAAWSGAAAAGAWMVNEGFATLVPLCALLVALWAGRRRPRLLAAWSLGLLLTLSPLVARNLAVGAPPFGIAANSSTVFAVHNAYGASPYFFLVNASALPVLERSQGRFLATVGQCLASFPSPWELLRFYALKGLGLIVPIENPDNVNFYYVALRNPWLAWLPRYPLILPLMLVGAFGARSEWRRLAPLAPVTLSLLASIFATLAMSRHRTVLAVCLLPLAGHGLDELARWVRYRSWPPVALAGGCALLLAVVGQRAEVDLVFRGLEPSSVRYRPTEFVLGAQFYEGLGQTDAAIRELLDLARLDADRSMQARALIEVARLELERGRADRARATLALAVTFSARYPGLLLGAGDLYVQAQDPAAARACYEGVRGLPGVPDGLRSAAEERLQHLDDGSRPPLEPPPPAR